MADVYADGDGIPSSIDIFSRSLDTLHQHAILDGRSSKEFIDSIVTFTGQSAQVTQAWDRLISFGPNAIRSINSAETITEPNERAQLTFSIAGWSHGATRKLGLGRIVFLGEAAMCTAQLTGSNQFKMGINNQWANQNAQFCLNVVHWLTGFID